MSHAAHFSIHIDKGFNADILYVIDNFPIPSPPSVANIIPTLSSRSNSDNPIWESLSQFTSTGTKKEILASGKWMRNIHGNGWHYLSVRSSDFDTTAKNFPKHGISDVDRDYFAQRYLRTMEALGYLEGYATCKEMNEWYINFYSGLFDGGDPTIGSLRFLDDNYSWLVEQANQHWRHSDYWMAVRGLLSQLTGIVKGAQEGCPGSERDSETQRLGAFLPNLEKQTTLIHLLLMNANGDLYQIAAKYDQVDSPPSGILDEYTDDDYYLSNKKSKKKSNKGGKTTPPSSGRRNAKTFSMSSVIDTKSSDEDFAVASRRYRRDGESSLLNNNASRLRAQKRFIRRENHCSAMVKILDDKSDVLFGHNTWDDYQCAAPRIFKHYSHCLMEDSVPVGPFEVHFSSSPGLLSSVDDFYTIDGKGRMAVFETTIDMYNPELLKLVVPDSLLSWSRARVSNQLAANGQEWADTFSLHHSGTYVNQWMVVDYDRFTPGRAPETGFLTVLEEVPGLIHYEDMTAQLNNDSYWASYNNPYFANIAELSGNSARCNAAPLTACHDTDPRAKIFQQQQGRVAGLRDFQALMSYNDFRNDPLSLNDSCNAIACRQDLALNAEQRYPFGAIDAKVSSVRLASGQVDITTADKSKKQQQQTKKKKDPIVLLKMGPTTSNHQPPFCWSQFEGKKNDRGLKFFHNGQPKCFDYGWEVLPPLSS
eukprot:gene34039-43981_t